MNTKEQKAKEYAELKVKLYDKNHTIESYGMHRAMQQCNFDGFDIQETFEEGWDEAMKSQWTKVEDELPERMEEVFVIYEYQGYIQITTLCYIGEIVWYYGNSKIIAWMPIPSFDKILEDNKDVLQRLKDK